MRSSLAELDVGYQGYGGYAADMPMDGMEGPMMPDDYPGSVYDRQVCPEYWPTGQYMQTLPQPIRMCWFKFKSPFSITLNID